MKGFTVLLLGLVLGAAALVAAFLLVPNSPPPKPPRHFEPRRDVDTTGFKVQWRIPPWKDPTSLEEIRLAFDRFGQRQVEEVDADLRRGLQSDTDRIKALLFKASMIMYDGEAARAYDVLQEARRVAEASADVGDVWLYTIIFFQGVAGMRQGENDNCIDCRGAGACIFPLRPSAVHKDPTGSRRAVAHFTEYLEQFPDDLGVRWLLNLAYMTLGDYPDRVPPEYRLNFDQFGREDDIGRFNDISHLVGLHRLNLAGGAVMDDFDNDGLLDLVTTSMDPGQVMAFYRNKGDGTFEDRTVAAGLSKHYGGLNLVQTDYNNDGYLDLYIPRGAWLHVPMPPSLLRNNGNGTFTDVTREAGLMDPVNSPTASWADFDNDGYLDLFVACERGPNRLYRNKGNGTFEDVTTRAGVQGPGQECKGATWIDYDNDGYPDLFLSYTDRASQLFHNNHDGTFTDVTRTVGGIDGPTGGFSCWAFDYDNDGWTDILATCYQRSLEDVVAGMTGRPPLDRNLDHTRLYRNLGGKGFQDVSEEMGVAGVFGTMGSNFADLDNDGYLDFYLATGDPAYQTLVPNRMFRNQAGRRFAEITTTAGTGHLQKGHGVACGDWDRDGNVDVFLETGGAAPGDRYHNVLFQNPGHGNHWLTLKLVGKKTNRAAIGARIKVVTAGDKPLTVHREVSRGSSFGGNPLQQTIGLGKAALVATVEVYWPTSRTTQVFHDVSVNQALEITEFAKDYRKLNWTRVPVPKE